MLVAFRRNQQTEVDSWIAWAEDHTALVARSGLACYEVPVLSGLWRPFRGVIDGGMAAAVTATEARQRTLTVYTEIRRVTTALRIADTDTLTVLLLSSDHRVAWRTTGGVSPTSATALEQALDDQPAR